MTTFSPDVVAAVLQHMNADHTDDNLVIVRAYAEPEAESVVMTGLDGEAGMWDVTVGGAAREVRIPWPRPVTERPEIRRVVVELYRSACARLGVTPRSE